MVLAQVLVMRSFARASYGRVDHGLHGLAFIDLARVGHDEGHGAGLGWL